MTPDGFDHIHVTLRGTAAGAITKHDIERRARELARLRSGKDEPTDRDRAAAEQELLGTTDPAPTNDDGRSLAAATRDPQFALQQDGQIREQPGAEDENTTPEMLALQGVEEAQHDLMLTSEDVDEENASESDTTTSRAKKRSAYDRPDEPSPEPSDDV
jgi:hypothetical protein